MSRQLCRVATSQQRQASNEGRSFGPVLIERFRTSRHAGKEGFNGFLGESGSCHVQQDLGVLHKWAISCNLSDNWTNPTYPAQLLILIGVN